jgi:hypothetical protein
LTSSSHQDNPVTGRLTNQGAAVGVLPFRAKTLYT